MTIESFLLLSYSLLTTEHPVNYFFFVEAFAELDADAFPFLLEFDAGFFALSLFFAIYMPLSHVLSFIACTHIICDFP